MLMTARFAGSCSECGQRFEAGTEIDYHRNAPKGQKAMHVDCNAVGPMKRDYQTVSYEVRTASGTFYQNRAGRCEDAPCCGCCTI